jgi:DNA-binding HxlR family transcriptional regulator
MPLRTDWSDENCPIARGADVLADPWTLLILREIFAGNVRFEGLRDALDIAENTLSSRLAALVTSEVIHKQPYTGVARPRFEYRLTDAGRDTLPVLHALAGWAKNHAVAPISRQMKVFCTRCGNECDLADWCSSCEASLTTESTAWERSSTNWRRETLAATT